MQRLDDYAASNGVAKIQFVKIDVEGAELFVLQGMSELLRSKYPPMLMLEVFPHWLADFGSTAIQLFDLLKSFGYEYYHMGASGLMHCRNPADAIAHLQFPKHLDFLFVIPNVHQARFGLINKLISSISNEHS
jgi:hypothetical protein